MKNEEKNAVLLNSEELEQVVGGSDDGVAELWEECAGITNLRYKVCCQYCGHVCASCNNKAYANELMKYANTLNAICPAVENEGCSNSLPHRYIVK
jgi:hypothetical protein